MTTRSLLVLLSVLALALAGCSSGSDSSEGSGGTNGAGGATTGTVGGEGGEASGEGDGEASGGQTGGTGDGAATCEADASAFLLTVAETSLGPILADGRGHTVYLFTPDKVGKKSVCTGPCTQVWIPLRQEGEQAAGDGVDASLIATIKRPDGSKQVTYKGHPLYTMIEDKQPGEVKGQSVGGVWFAVTPSGEQAG
jgi:predicted lipoprotein with Yx(FWY)xxD motif